jgi:hypothetical protein
MNIIPAQHFGGGADLCGRFTAIWQAERPNEREWIDEIFGPYIKEHVYDGNHSIALDNAILFDAFITERPVSYYEMFRGRHAFLVHFLDEFYDGGYERYTPFLGVFRKFWARAFEGDCIRPLPVGYCNGFRAPDSCKPASRRAYVWSFAGALGKSTRPDAVRALRAIEPYRVHATDRFRIAGLAVSDAELDPKAAAALLQDSAFAPSPMGNVNLECFRLYEALEAGAIPLLEKRLAFDYFTELLGDHPLPTFYRWRDAAGFVSDIAKSPARMDGLQRECRDWWAGYKLKLSADAGNFFHERLTAQTVPKPIPLKKVNSPLWQYSELLKHQTGRSLIRRAGRHIVRFRKTGRFRFSDGI